jgi:membrane protein YqaA with SNARE-associated domain
MGVLSLVTYLSLFTVAFLAATILPLQSETVLTALLALHQEPWWALIAVASLGNTLGAVVNWGLGLGLQRFQSKSWFPATPQQLEKATAIYQRFGRWCLLLSWLPIGGDALTVVAGVLREKLWVFVLLVGVGKTARYLALAAALAQFW